MSLAHRQLTCVVCGKPFEDGEELNLEPLIDPIVRYVATHWNETTFVVRIEITEEDKGNGLPEL